MNGPIRTTVPGQVPGISAAVTAGHLVFTAGIVCPGAMYDAVPVEEQIADATDRLIATLTAAGARPEDVVRIEAFLASADDLPTWNTVYTERWPLDDDPPARTSLIVGFAAPTILFEVQAVAVTRR